MHEETEQLIQNLIVCVEDSKSFPQILRRESEASRWWLNVEAEWCRER